MSQLIARIEVHKDDQSGFYYAVSHDVGLAVESQTLEGLMQEVSCAMPILAELAG
ncbi:MAG: DUF1902 domain-containing protein [Betaproteobacteria bacterium]|nr:DUF1902 domain-containing protein [Betaproteobacteria bacterium]